MIAISRPCYDKFHRCPGWAGGGMLCAKVQRCPSGSLGDDIYQRRLWRLRFNRCPTCSLLVLPYAVRWLDPRWWSYKLSG